MFVKNKEVALLELSLFRIRFALEPTRLPSADRSVIPGEFVDFLVSFSALARKMFSISSQRRNWMFKNEEELEKLRLEANTAYIEERRAYAEISVNLKEF